MTATAQLLASIDGDLPALCVDCAKPDAKGLCRKESCRRAVLPQMAKPSLVRLIGDTLTEQKTRQTRVDPKDRTAIERIGRRNARRASRHQRGGYFGLARAIMTRKDGT